MSSGQYYRTWSDSVGARTGPYHPFSTFPGLSVTAETLKNAPNAGHDGKASSGGDTDTAGNDKYMMVRMVGIRANLFISVKMEAEDNDKLEWKIRYLGQEVVTVSAPKDERADTLEISNEWDWDFTYGAKDFDAIHDNDFDEDKYILQKFKFVLELIDGEREGNGHKFEMLKPESGMRSTTFGIKVTGGASKKAGSDGTSTGVEGGLELGFGWGSSNNYTNWQQTSDTDSDAGTAEVEGNAPCPSLQRWWCNTIFDGEFIIRDYGWFNGSDGSRQDLQLVIHNYISAVTIGDCVLCPPREPEDPPPTEPDDMSGPNIPPVTLPTTPTTTPSNLRYASFTGGNKARDVTGDGERNGVVGGQVTPDVGNWCGTPPYFLGVAHRPANATAADGYDRVDRWSVGDADDDRMTSALVDPWDTQDGRRALVVLKDVTTGNCRLALVLRATTASTSGTETWPDRTATMPVDGYVTTELDTEDLSALFPTDDVAGAILREVELENNVREVWLVPLLVHDQDNDDDASTYPGEIPAKGYKVTADPVTGNIVLTAIDYDDGGGPDQDEP